MTGKVFKIASQGADVVARDFAKVGAAGASMEKALTQGAKSVPPSLRAIDTAAAEAKKKVEGLAGSAGTLGKVFSAMGPVGIAAAAGVGILTGAFAAAQGAAKQAGAEMLMLQGAAKQAGVSVEFLQATRLAFTAVGRDVAAIEPALKTFVVRLGEIRDGIGQGSLDILARVGITKDDVAGFTSAEDGLLKIAAALQTVDKRTAFNVADKLGIIDLIPLLDRGADGFRAMQQQAISAGLIIEESVVSRAAQTARELEQADKILSTQLKQAALDAAPAFLELAKIAAAIALSFRQARDFQAAPGKKSTVGLREDAEEAIRERRALVERFGSAVLQGGDAARGGETPQLGGLIRTLRTVTDLESGRDRAAALLVQINEARAEIQRRRTPSEFEIPVVPGVSGGGSGGGGAAAPAIDAERERLARFVADMDAASASAVAFAAAQARMQGATEAEVQAQLRLEAVLADLNAARAKGVILTDEDLERRRAEVIADAEAEKVAQRRTAALADVQSLLTRAVTPTQIYTDEVVRLKRAHEAGAISAEDYAEAQARAQERLKEALAQIAETVDDARTRVGADIEDFVGASLDTLENALRTGTKVSGDDAKAIVAQFLRDVLYDAIVGTSLDDLEALAVAKLKKFFQSVFDASSSKSGKGGKGNFLVDLFTTIVGAVTGGGGGAPGKASPPAKKISGFSTGGDFTPGLAMVGESGRELVEFGRGGRVFDAASTNEMLTRAARGGGAPQLTFAPVIQLAPGVTAEEFAQLRSILDERYREFRSWATGEPGRTVATMTEAKRRRAFR